MESVSSSYQLYGNLFLEPPEIYLKPQLSQRIDELKQHFKGLELL